MFWWSHCEGFHSTRFSLSAPLGDLLVFGERHVELIDFEFVYSEYSVEISGFEWEMLTFFRVLLRQCCQLGYPFSNVRQLVAFSNKHPNVHHWHSSPRAVMKHVIGRQHRRAVIYWLILLSELPFWTWMKLPGFSVKFDRTVLWRVAPRYDANNTASSPSAPRRAILVSLLHTSSIRSRDQ